MTSSMISSGLNWYQAWIAVWLGYAIVGVFVVLNAHAGAKYHCPFPVINRITFGIWGSLWPVLNRAFMACVWYGVQSWIGGQATYVLFRSLWPSYIKLPNSLAPSTGTDSAHFLTFFIFWLISLIPIYFPIHQIKHFFTFKAIISPIAGLIFFIWFVVKAGGLGPIVRQPSRLAGSELHWAFVTAVASCISNMVTLVTNSQDFSSRADKLSSAMLPQLIAVPLTFGFVSFFGIILSSTSVLIYGREIWSPLDLLEQVLNGAPSGLSRATVAFIAFSFIISQMGTNIAANSVSAGCDMTALLPRYINIRRGSYIAALIGLCLMPWKLLSGSSSFTTYLSAYSVFLSSIIGCMLAEYYVISHQVIEVDQLYSADRSGLYYYFHGFNLWAYTAYIVGLAINLPGFINAVGGPSVPVPFQRIYDLSFFTGLGISFVIYITLSKIFPPQNRILSPPSQSQSQSRVEEDLQHSMTQKDISFNGFY